MVKDYKKMRFKRSIIFEVSVHFLCNLRGKYIWRELCLHIVLKKKTTQYSGRICRDFFRETKRSEKITPESNSLHKKNSVNPPNKILSGSIIMHLKIKTKGYSQAYSYSKNSIIPIFEWKILINVTFLCFLSVSGKVPSVWSSL